ncbi:hypothetical protein BV898_05284 [Hypsibius exemplaris]|uniref:Uncharacterized protein n=1 Tax=Hypsibius exemplaris TaxID=2072580 RepID=A0A1W0WZR6_HYPEX|nr:hypothetical protein BV898_05284 [Hypsibius exemplaris]
MADLDDFFKKKDKKKAGKKQEEVVKATDLFKVLDNAAQNGLTEDLEENRNAKKQLELGPVLSEVVNPEEASKWSEPLEEERYYDLSNLKIESLQTPEDDEAALALAAAQDETPKVATMKWSVPALKNPPAQTEVKIGTPGDAATAAAIVWTEPPEKKKEKIAALVVEQNAPENPQAEHPHRLLETVASGVGTVVGTVVGAVAGLLHTTEKKEEESPASTEGAKSDATDTTEKAKEPGVYMSPAVRAAREEEARAAALLAKSGGGPAAPARSSAPTSTPSSLASGTPGGVYKSIGMRKAEEEERAQRLGTASGTRPSNYKKPELDNEEEFPTLGGGGGKHK